jgi:hypothetical protein
MSNRRPLLVDEGVQMRHPVDITAARVPLYYHQIAQFSAPFTETLYVELPLSPNKSA